MSIEGDRNSYARQRLGEAVECLVVSEDPLRVRLTRAAYHLRLLRTIWAAHKRSSIAERVNSIADELTKEPLYIEDHLMPRKVSPKRAKALAKEILDLYTEAYGGPA